MRSILLFWLAAFACGGQDAGSGRVPAAGGRVEAASGTRADSAVTASRFQPTASRAVEFYPSSDLSRITAAATGGRTFGTEHPTFHYVESRRVVSGSPEIHDHWVDVTIVQAGRATLLSGGAVNGGNITEPGEHRGGTIVGGTPHAIQAGDMFMVPAGTPHQLQLGQGDTIRYLTIKIAQP